MDKHIFGCKKVVIQECVKMCVLCREAVKYNLPVTLTVQVWCEGDGLTSTRCSVGSRQSPVTVFGYRPPGMTSYPNCTLATLRSCFLELLQDRQR